MDKNDVKMSKAVEERAVAKASERYTKFLNLYLPGESNFYRVEEDQNQNFEKIDGALETAQRMATDLFSKKQDKTDSNLQTDAKEIVPAINEINKKIEFNRNTIVAETDKKLDKKREYYRLTEIYATSEFIIEQAGDCVQRISWGNYKILKDGSYFVAASFDAAETFVRILKNEEVITEGDGDKSEHVTLLGTSLFKTGDSLIIEGNVSEYYENVTILRLGD